MSDQVFDDPIRLPETYAQFAQLLQWLAGEDACALPIADVVNHIEAQGGAMLDQMVREVWAIHHPEPGSVEAESSL
jgi:hypothetical protein